MLLWYAHTYAAVPGTQNSAKRRKLHPQNRPRTLKLLRHRRFSAHARARPVINTCWLGGRVRTGAGAVWRRRRRGGADPTGRQGRTRPAGHRTSPDPAPVIINRPAPVGRVSERRRACGRRTGPARPEPEITDTAGTALVGPHRQGRVHRVSGGAAISDPVKEGSVAAQIRPASS